jgi:hypothetical protein
VVLKSNYYCYLQKLKVLSGKKLKEVLNCDGIFVHFLRPFIEILGYA